MDMMRRVASGESQRCSQQLRRARPHPARAGVPQTAERLTASLSPQDRRFFEDYARGVQCLIPRRSRRSAAEFRLLNYQPRRWQPVDSILIVLNMVQTLDEQWPTKLTREAITRKIGPTLAATSTPPDHGAIIRPPRQCLT